MEHRPSHDDSAAPPAARLVLGDGTVVADADAEAVRLAVLAMLRDPSAAVVCVRPDGSFLQVSWDAEDDVLLEGCDFARDESFRCAQTDVAVPRAADVMVRYACGDMDWRLPVRWEPAGVVECLVELDSLPTPGQGPAPSDLVTRQQFRAVRRAGWITFFLAVNTAAITVVGLRSTGVERWILLTIASALGVATVGLHLLNCRCPQCGRPLVVPRLRRCPFCNASLRE